jgi:hypothetical protein
VGPTNCSKLPASSVSKGSKVTKGLQDTAQLVRFVRTNRLNKCTFKTKCLVPILLCHWTWGLQLALTIGTQTPPVINFVFILSYNWHKMRKPFYYGVLLTSTRGSQTFFKARWMGNLKTLQKTTKSTLLQATERCSVFIWMNPKYSSEFSTQNH